MGLVFYVAKQLGMKKVLNSLGNIIWKFTYSYSIISYVLIFIVIHCWMQITIKQLYNIQFCYAID